MRNEQPVMGLIWEHLPKAPGTSEAWGVGACQGSEDRQSDRVRCAGPEGICIFCKKYLAVFTLHNLKWQIMGDY